MSTPTLDDIAAHGNRGHHSRENNKITCADGTQISVIAGGGTYCRPRPAYCGCGIGVPFQPSIPLPGEVAHDYPGPYTHVEAWPLDDEGGGSDEPETWTVERAREFILAHGGEAIEGAPEPTTATPEIVCLCGSSRFYDEFQQANYDLTMAGKIVLSLGFYPHAKAQHGHGEGVGHDSAEKVALDELHKRKIDLADTVHVLNVGGYIGDSTRSEIEYAQAHGKPITYLESPKPTTCRADELRKGDVFTDPMGEWTMLADPEPEQPGVVALFVSQPRHSGGRYVTVLTKEPERHRPLTLVSRAKDGDHA